jgi:hypothetical protein
MTTTEAPRSILEQQFHEKFVHLVGELSLAELAVPIHFRTGAKLPEPIPLEEYSLWPITSDSEGQPTTWPAGYDYRIVTPLDACHSGGGPFLDAAYGIGIGYKRHLLCFSAAGIAENGAARVVQFQGNVRDVVSPAIARGLRGGFWWTDTLLEAWAATGKQAGLNSIEIAPADQSSWWGDDDKLDERLIAKYDKTAMRCGLLLDETGMWARPL